MILRLFGIKSVRSRPEFVIGYAAQPSGGYGNWAFQVNLLVQIGLLARVPAVIPRYKEGGFPKPIGAMTGMLSGSAQLLAKSMVEEAPLIELTRSVVEYVSAGQSVSLETGILGEPFNKFSVVDPMQLFSTKRWWAHRDQHAASTVGRDSPSGHIRVCLHYRGTDFSSWDPTAVMSVDYYLEALEKVRVENPSSTLSVAGVTDEPGSVTVQQLTKTGVRFSSIRERASKDFSMLRRADVVIAPPSTFSFWASMLGGKVIYFPKAWVSQKAKSSNFWWHAGRNSLNHINVRLV